MSDTEYVHTVERVEKLESRVQNLEHAFAQLGEIADRVRKLEELLIVTCSNCEVCIPPGQGVGWSVPVSEWPDETKSRGVKITPLCMDCMCKVMLDSEKEKSNGSRTK